MGGTRKYLLTGLMKCAECGGNYTLDSAHSYRCGTVIRNGRRKPGRASIRTCGNHERARREQLEVAILGPIDADLLAPHRVAKMAREMEAEMARRVSARNARAESAPKELQDLDARIARLGARLATGDPDMPSDELQAAIARVETKRAEL